MAISESLLTKLGAEQRSNQETLINSSAAEGTLAVKDTAEKHLLALTSKAIETIDSAMDYGDAKTRLAAAKEILSFSPATKPTPVTGLSQSGLTLPPAAVEALLLGLASMFQNTNNNAADNNLNPSKPNVLHTFEHASAEDVVFETIPNNPPELLNDNPL